MEVNGQERTRARGRLWFFSATVLLVGTLVAGFAAYTLSPPADQPFRIPWLVLGLAFLAAERLGVNLEVRKEVHVLTFTELPLTLGLIFATPADLVYARLALSALALVAFRRPPPVKVAFNTGLFGLDVGVSLIVFHAVLGSASPVEPIGWLAAFTAIGVSHLLCAAAVSLVMHVAGAPVTLRSQSMVAGVSFSAAMAGCAVALGASGALWRESQSWVLLLVIGLALGYFFVSYLRMRERHRDLSTLHGFTTSLAAADVDHLSETVVTGLADLLRAPRVVVLAPKIDGFIKIEYSDGAVTIDPAHAVGEMDWAAAIAVAGQEFRRVESGVVAGVSLDDTDVITARLPLPDRAGLVLVDGRLSSVRPFDSQDLQLLETASGHAATALHNSQLVSRLREEAQTRAHQALHDETTDLPNSRALSEQLDGQLATGTRLVMMSIRVDSLREVNETLGRTMGDQLLRQVAARLRPLGRRSWCARSGSDEFALVVPGGQDEADMLAERVLAAFDQPVLCDGVALAITVGVGVALAPTHGIESEILLRRASLAASRSRLDGTTVTTWALDRDPYDANRLTIAADLRDAIPNHELAVHFQPQQDIATGLITGVEALVRWHHPRLGQLRPDQFIAAAENTGAIDALTLYVLETGVRAGTKWHRKGWDLDVAVNLSARNLSNQNFAGDVAAILETAGFNPGSLTLELTESSVMTESERAMSTLAALDAQGIQISIDDFGTGYSSLAHLRRLPVSEIKIDKSFVLDLTSNESDEAIVRSMIELGHNLGLEVVIEGVETVEVRTRLEEMGSDRLQGYLLSRPLALEAFEHWAADRRLRRQRPVQRQVIDLDGRR